LQEKERRDWVDIHQMVLKSSPIPRPKLAVTRFGKLCQKIYFHPRFETFIYASIIVNVLILCLKWEGISPLLMSFFEKINIGFTGIFIIEAIVKITSTGQYYFMDYWNIFDLTITILSCFTIILDGYGTIQVGGSMMVIRSFRIAKILRLIKQTRSLRHIFKTFIHCLKPLTNIGSLLVLILYMYTIAGVNLFG
jgi:Ion transport protein